MSLPGLPLLLQSIVSGILMGGVYGLIAIGLTLIFGVMRIINFAHGSFMMLGMFTTYWVFILLGIDPYLSLLISIPVLFIFGLIVERLLISRVLEAPEYNQLLLTLGISLFIENFALFLWSPNFRTLDVGYLKKATTVGVVMISFPKVIAFLFAFLLTGVLYYFLKYTDLGKAIRASSEERRSADGGDQFKKDLLRGLWNWHGLRGRSGHPHRHVLLCEPPRGGDFCHYRLRRCCSWGNGKLHRSSGGGLIIGLAESVAAAFVPGQLKQFVIYFIFILVLLFKPEGLFGRSREG